MRLSVTLTWKRLLLAGIAAGLAALAVGWSGFVSIAANTGHFAPVGWFLHWTMGNAVDTQSIGISVPEGVSLSDPALVRRGAGHFQTNCVACHGAPGQPQSAAMMAMMPPPPPLADKIGDWRDRELFWIIRHGIKYSGMPAWTTQSRPDEVWAMVAFLRTLPTLQEDGYRALAFGEGPPAATSLGGDPFEAALAGCARCHGMDGAGQPPAGSVPVIAGQSSAYLLANLKAFAVGSRDSGIMQPAASIHDDAMLARLAEWYADQALPAQNEAAAIDRPFGATVGEEGKARLPRGSVAADRTLEVQLSDDTVHVASAFGPPYEAEGLAELGRTIAEAGLPDRKIAACESCHGAAARSANPNYPYLSGQPEWYLAAQLELWKHRDREGGPHAHVMEPIAVSMTQEQIDAVSLWYALQPAAR